VKFVSLDLRNWRSFHGDNHVDFSTDPERPVTLLLGPNGAGKTNLLNAFTWALYGQFTEGFDEPNRLVNLEAIELDPAARAVVELVLNHQEDEFRVKRVTDARRQAEEGGGDLTVTKNGERAVEDDIHRILPPPLKDLFFFPAETFSTASVLKGDNPGEGTSFDVGTAIRALLSGDIYDHAFADLGKAMASEALKPPKNYRDEYLEQARRNYEQAQAELNAAEERRDSLPGLVAQAREQAARAKKDAERYNPEEIRKWEAQYKELDGFVKQADQGVAHCQTLYVDLARSAHMNFSRCGVATAIARLDLAETAGLMPPRIHEHVLERTLSTHKCSLCGEKLTESGEARVANLRERVGDAQVAIRGVEIRTMLRQYAARYHSELDRIREEITALARRFEVDVPAPDADTKILGSVMRSCIDIADSLLAQAWRAFNEFNVSSNVERPADGQNPVEIAMIKQGLVDTLVSEIDSVGDKVDVLKGKTRELFSEYETKSGKTKEHARKTSAIAILQEAKLFFDEARKGLERFGRQDFEEAINKTYSELIKKELQISVAEDFSIRVFRSGTQDRLALSQSEKVLLLIAFLGAIARLAPHYEEIAQAGQQLTRTGSVKTSQQQGFPVVLDAPTSPLDDEYEKDVVAALPRLLPQVVIPVSARSVDVWETIRKEVGAVYVMELTARRVTNRKVRWDGKDYAYSIQDDGVSPARTHITRIG
jgi:DNA sulfur modification protein DndD